MRVTGFRFPQVPLRFLSSSRFFFFESFWYGMNFSMVTPPFGSIVQLSPQNRKAETFLQQKKRHHQPSQCTNRQCKHLSNQKTLKVKRVIMILHHHVLHSRNHKIGIMTEPENVHHHSVVQVDNGPQQETPGKRIPKGSASVCIAQDKSEYDGEQNGGAQLYFLVVMDRKRLHGSILE